MEGPRGRAPMKEHVDAQFGDGTISPGNNSWKTEANSTGIQLSMNQHCEIHQIYTSNIYIYLTPIPIPAKTTHSDEDARSDMNNNIYCIDWII